MTTKPANIHAVLAKAQQAMTKAVKGAENPHLRSKYADLGAVQDACLPALHANGFAIYQPLVVEGESYFVETILAHESGEALSCRIPLILGKHDMQGLGSAITYARRYGLLCMSGIAPEDDDGNKAAEQGRTGPPQRAASPNARHEMAVKREIANMETILSYKELEVHWDVLKEEQPEIARDQRVKDAKDELKATLLRKQKEAAQ